MARIAITWFLTIILASGQLLNCQQPSTAPSEPAPAKQPAPPSPSDPSPANPWDRKYPRRDHE